MSNRHIAAIACLLLLLACTHNPGRRQPVVDLETAEGIISLAIHAEAAPASSRAFLAQVQAKRYDGGSFFRAVRPDNDHAPHPIQVVQAGVREDGLAFAEEPIPHEDTAKTGLRHVDGAVSLPRAAIGTTSAKSFFISIGAQPALDHGGLRNTDGQGFAVFGQVTCGMDVVRKIQSQPVSASSPAPAMQGQILAAPVKIIRARMVSRRPCYK